MLAAYSNKDNITPKEKDKSYIKKDTYLICPDCGNFILYTSKEKYCSVCGQTLLSDCPDCHEPVIYPVSKYCPVCGRQLKQ